MPSRSITLKVCTFAAEIDGEGPPLLLLHAGICDKRMWRPQIDAFAGSHMVISPDLRGYGESALPPGSFSNHGDMLDLLDALDLDRFVVAGVSMGAGVALDIALTAPERVAGLVLSTTRAAIAEPWPEIVQMWSEVEALMEADDVDGANELELRAWVDGPHRTPDQVDPQVRALVAEMNGALLRRAMTTDIEDVDEQELDPLAHERLGDVRVPTLVISTDGDQPEVLASCARLAAGIPGARHRVIPGAAHLPSMEQPEQFNGAVNDFLSSIGW